MERRNLLIAAAAAPLALIPSLAEGQTRWTEAPQHPKVRWSYNDTDLGVQEWFFDELKLENYLKYVDQAMKHVSAHLPNDITVRSMLEGLFFGCLLDSKGNWGHHDLQLCTLGGSKPIEHHLDQLVVELAQVTWATHRVPVGEDFYPSVVTLPYAQQTKTFLILKYEKDKKTGRLVLKEKLISRF
jgi:hypothetical protein